MYKLVRQYRGAGQLWAIKKIVQDLPNEPLKVSFESNPFYWALYAAKHDGEVDVSHKYIPRYSAQMLYADKHKIDPDLIVGFIYQQGDEKDLANKLANDDLEEWYW